MKTGMWLDKTPPGSAGFLRPIGAPRPPGGGKSSNGAAGGSRGAPRASRLTPQDGPGPGRAGK